MEGALDDFLRDLRGLRSSQSGTGGLLELDAEELRPVHFEADDNRLIAFRNRDRPDRPTPPAILLGVPPGFTRRITASWD